MIKGRGGALLREKIVACASNHRVTMITAEKRVERLGSTVRVPVEVSSIGLKHTERRLQRLRLFDRDPAAARRLAVPDRRRKSDRRLPFRLHRRSRKRSTRQLQCIAGVLETGLFIGLCDTLIVGTDNGAERIESGECGLAAR